MKMALVIFIPLLALSGCASLGGNAFYTYRKVGTDCEIKIDSGRVLKSGASLEVEGCNIKVTANSLEQGNSSIAEVQSLIATMVLLTQGIKNGNDSAGSNNPPKTETGGENTE